MACNKTILRSALTRRAFLRIGTTAAAAMAAVTGCSLGGRPLGAERAENRRGVPPLSELDLFNYAAGTQTLDARYQFTDKPVLIETAEAIRAMGASVIKFNLSERTASTGPLRTNRTLYESAVDPVFASIFNMPFGHYLMYAYPRKQPSKVPSEQTARDEEVYELCCHLLKTYSGTGKAFYIGHWEGDWELRGGGGVMTDPTPESIAAKIKWLNRRQQAVDDATRDTSHHNVRVYCYAEANRVFDSMNGKPGMANSVIPHTNIDFVSYSNYDTPGDIQTEMPKALDFIESKLPPKPGIQGRRVWVGEYGYPALSFSPQEQEARSRRMIRTALQWGCPFVLYWEMYNNQVSKEGKHDGFWLIDDKGVKQPVYYTHEHLLQWGRSYVAGVLKKTRRVPTFDDYRKRAVEFLDAMGS